MSPSWPEVKLGDVCEKITVGHVGPMVNEYVEDGIPFLRSQNIKPFSLDLDDIKYITPEFHAKIKKSALRVGDVAIIRTGYPGTAAVIPPSLANANCADLVIIRPGANIDAHFIAALFNSTWGKGMVSGRLVGAAQQHFNVSAAKEMHVRLPPLPTQRKIAAILSAYDDLIENNTRRVQVLEQMARALYREWFVEYRFPGHEQAEWVEDAEGGRRPKGWEWVVINEVAPLVTRGVAPKYNEQSEDLVINQKCIRDQRLSLDPARRHLSKVPPLKVLRFGDVLINSTGVGTLGRVAQVYQEPENLTVDTHVTIVRADPQKMALDYFGLALMELQPEFEAAGVGSTGQTELGRERIGSTPVLLPPLPLQKEFGERVQAMRQLSEQLLLRNANLRRTRDLLLPRLVSGELDVSGLRVAGVEEGTLTQEEN